MQVIINGAAYNYHRKLNSLGEAQQGQHHQTVETEPQQDRIAGAGVPANRLTHVVAVVSPGSTESLERK